MLNPFKTLTNMTVDIVMSVNPFRTLTNMTVDIVMSVSVMPMRAFVTPRDPTTSAAATDTATRP